MKGLKTAASACLLTVVTLASSALAGQASLGPSPEDVFGGAAIPEPPPPTLPDTMARDATGRVTIRAVRTSAPLELDGQLDEAVYADYRPLTGFIQTEPQAGALATEQTDVWLFYDEDHVFVGIRAWDSQADNLVATEMRRDNITMFNGNDIVGFVFDTFYDGRSSVVFIVNPLGGRLDAQGSNESQANLDWNPIWDVRTGRFDGGWTIEAAIPFRSLSYGPGREQLWRFNVLRAQRGKNETSFLTTMPPARGQQAILQVSLAATVVGLEVPADSQDLDIKPFVTSSISSDAATGHNLLDGDVGLDAKFSLTQGLTADLTINTDFAQVEADDQQVNLTRFSLFFPEKREFFLDNQGTFSFGGIAVSGGGGGNGGTPILFYSRRIGLDAGSLVPIRAGGRLTGRTGAYSLGVLSIQTDGAPASGRPATNFSVVRIKRDVLRRSAIGVLATRRSGDGGTGGANLTYGLDGTFAFFDNLTVNTFWARTRTAGLVGDDTSHRAQLNYNADRYGLQLEHLAVGANFNPEIGFVRRDDMRRTFGEFRFSPRLPSVASVRRLSWTGSVNYIENGAGFLETRKQTGEFAIEFQNIDRLSVSHTRSYELLTRSFPIAPGISVSRGEYRFEETALRLNLGQQRPVAVNLGVSHGSFFDGNKTTFSATRGRVKLMNQFSVEPTYSLNRVRLGGGDFTTHLLGTRATYTISPLVFLSAFVQYSSSSELVATNARLRWEYRPGSELFVVYNEQRDARASGFPDATNRAFIVKVNRLFRF